MKRYMFGALMMFIVAAAITVPVASAQTHKMLTANVPFAFSADGKSMPAGAYEVREVGARGTVIETKDGSAMILGVYSFAGENYSQATKLVFDKVGNQYFLREIWTSARGQGLSLPESQREKETIASTKGLGGAAGAETVIVAMR